MPQKSSNKTIILILFVIVFCTGAAATLYSYAGYLLLGSPALDHSLDANQPIPEFYKTLSKEEGDFKIIEYPVIIQDRFNPIPYYQSYHNKRILNGYFQSHALKKQWKLKDISQVDLWPLEIIASKLENNKIDFSRAFNIFHNFIDLYDIPSIKVSGAKYLILHKHIINEINTVKNINGTIEDMLKSDVNLTALKHTYNFTLHLKEYYKQYFGSPVYQDDQIIIFKIINDYDKTPDQKALITFQFDDTFITQYTIAKPLFDNKNIKATIMVRTSNAGKSAYFMSWKQLQKMHNEGWEIASHTVNHPNLRKADEAALRYELSRSKAVLEEHGFKNIRNFAYPYNWYDLKTLYIVPEYYSSARTSVSQTDFRINPKKIRPYELSGYEARLRIENVADTYKYVDKAQREGRWLIFILHEFSDNTPDSKTSSVEVSDIKALEMLIDYIQKKDLPIVTTDEALNYYMGTE